MVQVLMNTVNAVDEKTTIVKTMLRTEARAYFLEFQSYDPHIMPGRLMDELGDLFA